MKIYPQILMFVFVLIIIILTIISQESLFAGIILISICIIGVILFLGNIPIRGIEG